MRRYLLLLTLLLLVVSLAYRIDLGRSSRELIGELMYFPSGFALRALSMGYYGPLADLVWIRFIQYYGEHRLTDAKFEYMYHILDILTTLDPRFTYAYTLGGLMLTHDAGRPDQAKRLLKKGMRVYPESWRIPFIYGFIHYVFLREYHVAEPYFRIAAQRPNAPDLPKRWAAYLLYMHLGDLQTSLSLWIDLYNNSQNPEEKKIAKSYIKKIKMMMDIKLLNQKTIEFRNKQGRYPRVLQELVTTGLLDSLPVEPHGEEYVIKNGRVLSTWKEQ